MPGAGDVRDAYRPQQFDKRVDLLLVTRRLNDEVRVRSVDDLGAKDANQTQYFLPRGARFIEAEGNTVWGIDLDENDMPAATRWRVEPALP